MYKQCNSVEWGSDEPLDLTRAAPGAGAFESDELSQL